MALDTITVERLKTMRIAHATEQLRLGVGLTSEDVLAANEDGTPLRPEHLTTEWSGCAPGRRRSR